MKKLLFSLVTAGLVSSFAGCASDAPPPTTTTTTTTTEETVVHPPPPATP